MEQLGRSDSKESGAGVAIQNTLPHPRTPSSLTVSHVYLRTPGTAEDSPKVKLLWVECCQA